MNTPKKFRVWLPSLNKFGDDNSVFMNCYGKLYGVTRPSLVDDSRSIVNIGQFKELDGYTIQWYTGLNDSKGNPIYEGDILKEYTNNGNNSAIGVCKRTLGGWKIFSHPDSSICYHGWKDEVIGNIFEHKHLLEK